MIKKRKAKLSERGLYLQDKELRKTNFKVGTHFKYIVDVQNKQVIIAPTNEETKNTVSKREIKDGIKPVLDIRDKQALQAFKGADYLEIEIFENQVVVKGLVKNKAAAIFDFAAYAESKVIATSEFSVEELSKVVGSSYSHIQTSHSEYSSTGLRDFPIVLEAISLFSGSGIMDIPFLLEGFEVKCAVEINEDACKTYRFNHGDHIIEGDITEIDKSIFKNTGAPIVFGGSPCQGFSNANRWQNFLDNPNNLLVKEYIKSVQANPNTKVFILENVPQILTTGNGQFLQEITNEFKDFEITYGVLNSKNYGDPQDRERAIIIGSKIGPIDLPAPTVDSYVTVGEAFKGLHDGISNQLDVSQAKQTTIERMEQIKQGQNWEVLPEHLKTNGMRKGNTHSNIYKRLSEAHPACTIVNPRKCLLTHPILNRILSVRECARLFSVPDDFVFLGKLESKQQQIANAVPVRMMRAVANKIKNAVSMFNRQFGIPNLSLV